MPQQKNNMSIRLFSDGHSFPEHQMARMEESCVELCTHRTLLIPAQLFSLEEAEELLVRSGLAPKWGERVVASAAVDGMVALMAIPEELLRRVPSTVQFSSPLLTAPTLSEGIWMMPCEHLLYIKVWRGGRMQLAEVFDAERDEEILYYALQLAQLFSLKGCPLHYQGPCSASLKRQLKPSFKLYLCE